MKVGIVGAGVAGLAAAYRLLQRGHEVVIAEASPVIGGQVRTFDTDGEPLEAFYHHLFRSDTSIIGLIEELGLGSDLEWIESRVGFYRGGRLYDFVTPMDLLRFSPVGLVDRARLGGAAVYLQRQKDWRRYEGITARDWIVKHVGRRAYDAVWGPLLRGKYGVFADEVSMAWFWGKIYLRFASRKGVLGREQLGYLRGSFGRYIEALGARIRELGGDIMTGTPVEQIVMDGGRAGGLRLGGESRQTLECDAVLVTVANKFFVRMAPDLPAAYTAALDAVRYQWATCLVLGLDRPLSGYYWLNISAPEVPFVAAVEHTNFVSAARYGGRHYVYFSNYTDADAAVLGMDVDEVLAHYLPHIRKINPGFEESWIVDRNFFKDPAGQPIITCNYSDQIPDHRTPLHGVYLANTTQIYPEDRGQNYSILMGERIAEAIDGDLRGEPQPALGRLGSHL